MCKGLFLCWWNLPCITFLSHNELPQENRSLLLEPSAPPANWRVTLFLRDRFLGLFSCPCVTKEERTEQAGSIGWIVMSENSPPYPWENLSRINWANVKKKKNQHKRYCSKLLEWNKLVIFCSQLCCFNDWVRGKVFSQVMRYCT